MTVLSVVVTWLVLLSMNFSLCHYSADIFDTELAVVLDTSCLLLLLLQQVQQRVSTDQHDSGLTERTHSFTEMMYVPVTISLARGHLHQSLEQHPQHVHVTAAVCCSAATSSTRWSSSFLQQSERGGAVFIVLIMPSIKFNTTQHIRPAPWLPCWSCARLCVA
jgi:hypothetical protein